MKESFELQVQHLLEDRFWSLLETQHPVWHHISGHLASTWDISDLRNLVAFEMYRR